MLTPKVVRVVAVGAIVFGTLVAGRIAPATAARGAGAAQAASASNVMDMAYPCGFTNPAFCDNFSEGPAPVKGRGNDLDYRKWSFSRNDAGATGSGAIWAYYPTTAQHCKTTIYNVNADHDSFFCGSEVPEPEHWMEAFNDGGSYQYNDGMIRQPFDFSNRTGTIQYGVDAKNAGSHGWWTETWISDQPAPGPNFQELVGSCCDEETQPANAVGIAFDATCGASIPSGNNGAPLTGVGTIRIMRNHTMTAIPNDLGDNTHCVTAQPDSANLIQIKLSTTHVEVWMSNHGSNVLQEVASATISPALPFSVGYVHFEHVQYNAAKNFPGIQQGLTPYQTYHWHDMGFDGPVWPTPRAYEIPDSLTPTDRPSQNGDSGGQNLGYLVYSDGRIYNGATYLPNFSFNNVDVTNASEALLNLNTGGAPGGSTFYYQFNNGPVRSYTVNANVTSTDKQTHSIPVPLSDLKQGTNTLILKADPNANYWAIPPQSMIVANIDLEVIPNGGPTVARSAGFIPCSLWQLMMQTMPNMVMVSDPCNGMPTPTGTSMPKPTNTPASATNTPIPSATKTLQPTATRTAVPATSTRTPVPTATPTRGTTATLGLTSVGSVQDTGDANYMNGSRITVGSRGETVTSLSAHVGAVDSAPHNQFAFAIYSDYNGAPGTLIAYSAKGTLTANAWNTLPVRASLAPNTSYWLMYNTNGTNANVNNMAYTSGSRGSGAWSTNGQTFGAWPASFGSTTFDTTDFSLYATVSP